MATGDDAAGDEGVGERSMLSALEPIDVAVILTVPGVLLALHLLPDTVRESFAFVYAEPSLETAFTATYVHLDQTHLANNLISYLVVVPTAYLLEANSGRRRRFVVVFTTFVLGLGPVLSYLNLAIARPGATLGFSVLNLAFLGYLAIAIGTFVDHRSPHRHGRDLSALVFLVGLGWTAVLLDQRPLTYLIAGCVLALGVGYALTVSGPGVGVRSRFRRLLAEPGRAELTLFATLVFLAVPVFSFATLYAPEGATVNRWGHLVGFTMGFLGPFVTGRLLALTGVRM